MWDYQVENWILYEDKDILVCHKPAGIAVQTARIGIPDMESGLKNYLAQKGGTYLAVVHRLDQPVEGILVFAKTPKAAKELSRQVSGGGMEKCYLAVTEGKPEKDEGILEHYLKKDGRTNTSSVVPKGTPGAKLARLSYKVRKGTRTEREAGKESVTLAEIHLETGRHHQIRVQMAAAGLPLLGDRKYNPHQTRSVSALGLCSYKLSFVHPATGKEMRFETKPQGDVFFLCK